MTWLDWWLGRDLMPAYQCLRGNWWIIGLAIILDALVVIGYGLIAWHWWINRKRAPDSAARRALDGMIFVFATCGLCGYGFTIIRMFWPVWRVYNVAMVFLVFVTYRYLFRASKLRVVFRQMTKEQRKLEKIRDIASHAPQLSPENRQLVSAILGEIDSTLNSLDEIV